MFHDAENVPRPDPRLRPSLNSTRPGPVASQSRKISTKIFNTKLHLARQIVPRTKKCSTKLFHAEKNVPHYAKNLSLKRRKVKIVVATRKTSVILCYMEINTTQKTVEEIRVEIENIRSQMCGHYAYLGMLDKNFFNLYTKEQLVEQLAGITTNAKKLQNQYDRKITEMINA